MKYILVLSLLLSSVSHAWVVPQQQPRVPTTALEAKRNPWIAGTVTGWVLATQIVSAAIPVSPGEVFF